MTPSEQDDCPPGFSRCGFLVKPIGLGEDEWYMASDEMVFGDLFNETNVVVPLYCRTDDCDPFAWKASRMGEDSQ